MTIDMKNTLSFHKSLHIQIRNLCITRLVAYVCYSFSNYPVTDISCGDAHNCALVMSGVVYSWGDNSAGQLGITHTYTEITKPRQIATPTGHSITQVACGAVFSAALSGEWYGSNESMIGVLLLSEH